MVATSRGMRPAPSRNRCLLVNSDNPVFSSTKLLHKWSGAEFTSPMGACSRYRPCCIVAAVRDAAEGYGDKNLFCLNL
jgi:hypothetical protein